MLCCFNVNADYFNYLVWSLLSEYSILTTASQVSCCVQRYVTIAFQHVFVLSITPLQWVSGGTVHGVLLDSGQKKVKPESSVAPSALSKHHDDSPPLTHVPAGIALLPSAPAAWSIQPMPRHAATRRPTSLWSQSNHQNVTPQQPAAYVQSF